MADSICLKYPPSLCFSSLVSPNSTTVPPSRTKILSESAIVPTRCAIVTTVAFTKQGSSQRVFWMSWSVLASTLAVASSRTTTWHFRIMARARDKSCRWPTERLLPPSATMKFSFSGFSDTISNRHTDRSALQIRSSSTSPNGSRLKRNVPEKSSGVWGIRAIRDRLSRKGTEKDERPSRTMSPWNT
jgi:hypothetical protein